MGKARELVIYLKTRNSIPEVVEYIAANRPDISKDKSSFQVPNAHPGSQSFQSSIRSVMPVNDPVAQEYVQNNLTTAWFQDLQRFDPVAFIAFDTYERAPIEIQQWIKGPFLEGVANCAKLRALFAGQDKPDIHTAEWIHYCQQRKLPGVTDATHWLRFISQMNIRIDAIDPHNVLQIVCDAYEGRPKDMMKFIEGLLRRQEAYE